MSDAYARRLQAEIDTANERNQQHIGTSQILPYIQGLTVALELYKLFVAGDNFERPVDNKVWNINNE